MIAREDAFNILKQYNKDAFHIQHALTVEEVMKQGTEETWVVLFRQNLCYNDSSYYRLCIF